MPAAEVIQKGADGKDEKVPNPALEDWEAVDQQVLGYLLSLVSKDVLTQVATSTTAAEAWKTIEDMFASQTRARSVNIRIALATTKKENSSVAEYFAKMKSLDDDMAAAGRPLEDEELVEYIITGLGEEFSPIVSALCARVEPISVGELYSQLLNFETRMDLIYGGSNSGSANSATRGRGSWRGKTQPRGKELPVVPVVVRLLVTAPLVLGVSTLVQDQEAVAPTTTVHTVPTTPLTAVHQDLKKDVKCASKRITPPQSAGTGSMRTMCQTSGLLRRLQPHHMVSTPIGT